MKKKLKTKKYNPYNFFVYSFKATGIVGLIIVFIEADLLVLEFVKKEPLDDPVLAVLFLIDGFFFLLSIYFMGIYEKKITTYIDKPKNPYKIILKDSNISSLLNRELRLRNFEITQEPDFQVYHRQKKDIRYNAKYVIDVVIFCSLEEVSKATKKYLVEKRQYVKKYKIPKCPTQTIILLKIPKMNEEFWKYLMDRTEEYFNNFLLLAVLVEDENCIYIPYPNLGDWPHHVMKKLLKEVLKDKIIEIKKKYKK